MGVPMLGTGFVERLVHAARCLRKTDARVGRVSAAEAELRRSGLPDDTHTWLTGLQRFSLTTSSWQRFSATGQDWSSHSLRDDGWK
jgi:hypothetical protein